MVSHDQRPTEVNDNLAVDPNDAWAIPATFYAAIVKWSAVVRSFPGGVEEFTRRFDPARKNGQLFSLPVMSLDDANSIFQQLYAEGIVPGQDVALVNMGTGYLVPCDGIRVTRRQASSGTVGHYVQCDPSYVVQPEDVLLEWNAPAAPTPRKEPLAVRAEQQPRRVTFRTGAVHWVYDGDEGDE